MKFTPHLKDEAFYRDLYDRMTVATCRETEERLGASERPDNPEGTSDPNSSKRWLPLLKKAGIYFLSGERFRKKAETIKKWMEIDQEKDERFERAKPPSGIRCLRCRSIMEADTRSFTARMPRTRKSYFIFSANGATSAVANLRSLLVPALEVDGYVKFDLGKRRLKQDVQIRFTVEDSKADRNERVSIGDLSRLIVKTLEDTNC